MTYHEKPVNKTDTASGRSTTSLPQGSALRDMLEARGIVRKNGTRVLASDGRGGFVEMADPGDEDDAPWARRDSIPQWMRRNMRDAAHADVPMGVPSAGKRQSFTMLDVNAGATASIATNAPMTASMITANAQIAAKQFPALFEGIKLPLYRKPEGFRTYEWIERSLIMNTIELATRIAMDGHEKARHSVPHIVYAATLAFIRNRFPLYFVGRDMLRAVLETDLPRDIKMSDVHWPLKSMIFMVPHGELVSPAGSEVIAIGIARIDRGETLRPPESTFTATLPDISAPEDDDAFGVWALCLDMHSDDPIHKMHCQTSQTPSCTPKSEPLIAHWAMDAPMSKVIEFARSGVDMMQVPDVGDCVTEDFFNNAIPTIALNMMLVMTARPELVESSAPIKRIARKGTTDKVTLYEPRWVGRNYRVRREHAEAIGTHASPRMHWRRGHQRLAPIGPRVSIDDEGKRHVIPSAARQHKSTWIEPILVNAKKDV